MSDLKKIKDEFFSKLEKKLNLSEINEIKSDLFGKNGLVSSQFKKIGSIDQIEKGNINYTILNNLAYGQWNMNEIDSGEAWEFLSKTIYK